VDLKRLNYLLHKLIEECAEVQKDACKALSFGIHNGYPDQSETNKDRIEVEAQDVYAALKMLQDEFDFDFTPDADKIQKKVDKVNLYYGYTGEERKLVGYTERPEGYYHIYSNRKQNPGTDLRCKYCEQVMLYNVQPADDAVCLTCFNTDTTLR
jgi:hypothetical protein